jgi:hypothetical protein
MRSLCTVLILAGLVGLAAPPVVRAATTSCVLSGTYVLTSALSVQGVEG